MQRSWIGFLAGAIGGLIKLVLDQITFAGRISTVDTVGMFSQILFPAAGTPQAKSTLVWIIYMLVTGAVGWLVSQLVPRQFMKSYLSTGLLLGVILWGAMNLFFAASGMATPTWSMGAGSLIVNLITHLVLGLVITYSLWRYGVEVTG